jgi:predicted outer membrane repeat protein
MSEIKSRTSRLSIISRPLIVMIFVFTGLTISISSSVVSQANNGQIRFLDWSPDGNYIAIAYLDIVEIYNVNTAQVTLTYTDTFINDIAWSPTNGALAIATSSYTGDTAIIKIIDSTTGIVLVELEASNPPAGLSVGSGGDQISAIAWSPDGALLAAGISKYSGSARETWTQIWDASNGNNFASRHETSDDIAWSPDGNYIVRSSVSGRASIVDLTQETNLVLEDQNVITIAWSPDGSYVGTGNVSGEVNIWDSSSGILFKTFSPARIMGDITWSPDSTMIASVSGRKLNIWSVITGENFRNLELEQVALAIVWSPNGNKVAYGGDDGQLHIINAPSTGPSCDADIPASDTATLISTITTANGSGNPTTICLAEDSTYTFTTANNYLNVLPYITGDITIEGHNATLTRSGTQAFRFFEVDTGGKLTLNDLTLSNGDVTGETERGGALMNDGGDITLNNVTFDGNSGNTGGAIDNEEGTLTINDSTFTNNNGVYGGAIDNDDVATLTISGSTFTTNHAFADGGAIHNDGGTLTVSDTMFTTNTADDYGGAIDNDDGDVTINASTFTSNSSDGGGAIRNDGTLTINAGSVFTTNVANNLGWGGAIYNKSGTTLIINATSFSGNTAALEGGAIRNQGNLNVNTGSSFDGNTGVQYGGAIYNTGGTVNLTGVELTNNTATNLDAGAIYSNSSGSLTLTDSILSGNDSGRRGGGIWSSGTVTLTNVSVTSNTAVVEGGGVYSSSSATISSGNGCITGNSSRAVYSASSTPQNFENNWWGATDGPSGSGSGSGDAVNSNIDYTPFITTSCPLP